MNYWRVFLSGAIALVLGVMMLDPIGFESEAFAGAKKGANKKGSKGAGGEQKHVVHIRKDIGKLQAARKDLASRPVHYGGHRERALQHIDHAIRELRTLEQMIHKNKGKKK